jgi:dephospho-CoA kinase
VEESEFEDLVRSGFFLEVVQLFGLPFRYGLPRVRQGPKGEVPAIMVRAPLMTLVDRHYPRRTVYHIEDSTHRVVERMMARGVAPSEVRARLGDLESERALGRRLASRVFVNSSTLAELVHSVAAAVDTDFTGEHASQV